MLLKLTQTLVFLFSWWKWYQELILYSCNKVERRGLLVSKCHVYRNNLVRYMYMTEMIIFSYLTDVSYFHLKKKSEWCRTWSEQVNNEREYRWFQLCFHWFSVILFSCQNQPWYEKFEDTKGVIRRRTNITMATRKRTNNDLQNIT